MVKIQKITRPNGTMVYPVYLTRDTVEKAGLKKGMKVEWIVQGKGQVLLRVVE